MSRFDDMIALDLEELVERLAAHTPVQHELAQSQWLGVVEALTARMTDRLGDLSLESLRHVSEAFSYTLQTAVSVGAIDHRESLVRRLNLSVALLQRYGGSQGIAVLEPYALIDLLLDELPMSADEAQAMSVEWRKLEISKIRTLRSVKNLVKPGIFISKLTGDPVLSSRLV